MPVLLNSLVVALLKTPRFYWNALRVPLNQRKMLLNDGDMRIRQRHAGPYPFGLLA